MSPAGAVHVAQWVFPEALAPLAQAGHEVDLRDSDAPAPTPELTRRVAAADALLCLLTDKVGRDVLAAAPRLRVVANVAAGYDNVDVAAATELGVAVTNTPGVLAEATADLTFALLLACARKVPAGDAYVRAGRFERWTLAQEQMGADVHGACLGILGLGEIGRAVARRAVGGFGMRVLYHSRRRHPEAEAELGVEWAEWDDLLGAVDFLSLHAPLTDRTRHVVDAAALARMKPTAVLLNTARGPLVDEAALAAALAAGRLGGAGLDVYEHEPRVHPDLLAVGDRAVLLPHLGSATETTRRRMAAMAVAGVLDVLAGRRPQNLVNPDVLAHPRWKVPA